MESLKSLAEIATADARHEIFRTFDQSTGAWRPIELKDLHEWAKIASLNEEVPKEIRSHFATAQNLVAYAWFNYKFLAVAEFQALVSLEMALRFKYRATVKATFKRLLAKAFSTKDLSVANLPRFASRATFDQPSRPAPERDAMLEAYRQTLIDIIPNLRNEFAHGSNHLSLNATETVQMCSHLINQLYRKPESDG